MPWSQKEPALEQRLFGAREAACLGNGAVQGESLRLMPFCAIIEQVFAKRRFRDVRRKGSSMKLGNIAKVAVAAAGVAAGVGAAVYGSRAATMASIRQIAPADGPYGLYSMDVPYRYDLDRIIERGLGADQGNMDAILAEALPLVPVHMQAPQFGCSAFTLASGEGVLMGRNYDFRFDTSAMLVHSAPADGYESIGFAPSTTLAWSMRCRRNRVSRAWRRRSLA